MFNNNRIIKWSQNCFKKKLNISGQHFDKILHCAAANCTHNTKNKWNVLPCYRTDPCATSHWIHCAVARAHGKVREKYAFYLKIVTEALLHCYCYKIFIYNVRWPKEFQNRGSSRIYAETARKLTMKVCVTSQKKNGSARRINNRWCDVALCFFFLRLWTKRPFE